MGILSVLALCWYLFLKKADYIVNFEIPTSVGTVNQSLKSWNTQLDSTEIITTDDFNQLKQQFKTGDSLHMYTWDLRKVNDSITRVSVSVKDEEHSIANRLAVPFSESVIEKSAKSNVAAFLKILQDHLKRIKITIEGETQTPATYFAYVLEKGLQIEKAKGMMKNISLLTGAMIKYDVELNGTPFVQIKEWNQVTDSISYNFCFPIKRSEKLPELEYIKYDKLNATKALKAEYNGNYITSDRAWYALLEYAESNNIKVDPKPIEFFYNNPNMGGDELNWKAEIYLPILD